MIILLEPSFPKFNYAEFSVLTGIFSHIESFLPQIPPSLSSEKGGILIKRLFKRGNYCLKCGLMAVHYSLSNMVHLLIIQDSTVYHVAE